MDSLNRPMTVQQQRALAFTIERLEHLISLAKINLGTHELVATGPKKSRPRKVWHAARAARYLRSGVNEANAELAKLKGIMSASVRDERKPLTPAQLRKVDATKRRMALKYGQAAA